MRFVWVRGGEWSVSGTVATPRRHPESISEQLRASSAGQGPYWAKHAPAWPPVSIQEWNDKWGAGIGAKAYEVGKAETTAALRAVKEFAITYSAVPALDAFVFGKDGTERYAPEIESELLDFLRLFGPLTFVKPLGNVPARPRDEVPTEVDLLAMAEELALLGQATQLAMGRLSTKAEEQERADQLVKLSSWYLQDVSAEPFVADGVIRLAARPATLIADLWLSVVDRVLTARAVCWECSAPLERRIGRGRPFAYCEEHRTEAAKKRRYRRGFSATVLNP